MSEALSSIALNCRLPISNQGQIRLGHGSGGKMSETLTSNLFLPILGNDILNQLDDAAVVQAGMSNIAVTTDAYVVNPIFFPGGDIGSLAVHGTVNDLSMRGARPLFLAASFILEEGLPLTVLEKIVTSFNDAATKAGIKLIAADTKVVNKGAADQIFITTTGIGLVESETIPSASAACVGDVIIISGQLAQHGMSIMCAREGLDLETELLSDSAPLNHLVTKILTTCKSIHCLRDLTRGGLASASNELAHASKVGIELDEEAIPIHPQAKAACELLGLDPLYVACEGRFLAIVAPQDAQAVLKVMQEDALGQAASIAGRVVEEHIGLVTLKSSVGGRRILDKLSGEQLPRIC